MGVPHPWRTSPDDGDDNHDDDGDMMMMVMMVVVHMESVIRLVVHSFVHAQPIPADVRSKPIYPSLLTSINALE